MKPYTWNEIKDILLKELSKTKHIMTFGTIGSLNIEHDIDLIITKKPSSKSSDFYKEVHHLFDNIDAYLKNKYKAKAVRFAFSAEEHIVRHLTENKKDISFHTMIYTSWPQIERDWNWALFKDENIKDILTNSYKPLIGSIEDLFSKEFQKENYCDPVFIQLYLYDKINSHYPKKLLVNAMNHYFDYLYRKRLKLKAPIAKNEKQVRQTFYKLCDILDKLTQKHF